MNILVRTHSGKTVVRPDTSWERFSRDIFLPETAGGISFTPVLFANISRPGKCVGRKFAERYYDGVNFGLLLYPDALMDGSAEGFACASCLDHTSVLPTPVSEKALLDTGECRLEINKNGKTVYTFNSGNATAMVEEAIETVTERCLMRNGDLLAIELDDIRPLCSPEEGRCAISADWSGRRILDFNIIL